MVFGPGDVVGSIGGGQLEWQAAAHAEAMLTAAACSRGDLVVQEWSLGPSLGQCCGGRVRVTFERADPCKVDSWSGRLAHMAAPVWIFGAGHVGLAIARASASLPLIVTLIDSRPSDPSMLRDGAHLECMADAERPQEAVCDIPSGAAVLVMTHSHVQDFDIVLALLERQTDRGDLAFIGLIGSQSKWSGFRRRLSERGIGKAVLDQVRCPIGLPGIRGKAPAVVAASVVAQLLTLLPESR